MNERPAPDRVRLARLLGGLRGAPAEDLSGLEERALAMLRDHRRRRGIPEGGEDPDPGPPRRWGRRWLTWPRVSLALNFILAGVIVVAASRYVFGFKAEARWDGSVVTVVNTAGGHDRELWARDFGEAVRLARVAPWDDGGRWVVVSWHGEGPRAGAIEVWDFRSGTLAWSHRVDAEELVPFYGEEMSRRSGMWCPDFEFADLEGDGDAEVVGVFQQVVYLPACVRTLSRTGETLGTYFNWGYLEDVLAADVDGDGKDEIVVCGTNNAPEYQGATLVLLDGEHLSGASVDEFIRADGFRDGAPVRIVLPQWPEGVRPLTLAHRLHAMKLFPSFGGRSAGEIRIQAQIGSPELRRVILVSVDGDFRVIWVDLSDRLAEAGREWLADGRTSIDISSRAFLSDWIAGSYRYEFGRRVPSLPPLWDERARPAS